MAKIIQSRVISNNANTVFVTPIDQNEFFDQNNIKTTSPITKSVSESIVTLGFDKSILPPGAKVFDSSSAFKEIHDSAVDGNPVYYKDENAIYTLSSFFDGAVYFSYVDTQVHTLKIDSDNVRTTTTSRNIVVLEYGQKYGALDPLKQYVVKYENGSLLYQANIDNEYSNRFTGIIRSGDTFKIVTTIYSSSGNWSTPIILECGKQVLTVTVNTTDYTLSDMGKYDVVILNAGGVKHLLTELTSKKAVFSGTYLVGDMVVSRTYTYDGTNWTVNDAGSLYRVKVNANTEPQYLFNAIVEGNGISITGGDSNTMTIASKTMVLTWRQAYPMDDLLKQEVLVCDVEGERYQCASKTDTKLTFTRADSEGIKTTTYDGEVWSDIKTVDYPKCYNILIFNTNTGIATFDESLPTKVYVPDEEIFYDCTKYETINGTQYFTITKDYNIFTKWARVPGDWGFQGMTWNSLHYYIDESINVGNTYTLDNSVLGKPVLLKYVSETAPDITISIGGVIFRNVMKESETDWLLEAHTDDELTWRGRLVDNGTKLQFTVDEAIENYTVEQFS